MHRTFVTRVGAALSLGLLASALSSGTIVAAAPGAHNGGAVHPNQCTSIAPGVGPSDCVEFNTSTDITSSVNPSRFGQSVTFTATVTLLTPPSLQGSGIRPSVPPPPTGTVDFKNGQKPLCTGVALNVHGVAKCTRSGLVVGDHLIGAFYNGDLLFGTSEDALVQTVQKAGTHSIISSSSRNSDAGQPVTLGVYVFSTKPGGGIPSGTFQFRIDGVKVGGPVALGHDGRAFLPPMSNLSKGPHLVGGKYSGDSNHRSSTPVRLLQYVNP